MSYILTITRGERESAGEIERERDREMEREGEKGGDICKYHCILHRQT